jgi:hypothetical protein
MYYSDFANTKADERRTKKRSKGDLRFRVAGPDRHTLRGGRGRFGLSCLFCPFSHLRVYAGSRSFFKGLGGQNSWWGWWDSHLSYPLSFWWRASFFLMMGGWSLEELQIWRSPGLVSTARLDLRRVSFFVFVFVPESVSPSFLLLVFLFVVVCLVVVGFSRPRKK